MAGTDQFNEDLGMQHMAARFSGVVNPYLTEINDPDIRGFLVSKRSRMCAWNHLANMCEWEGCRWCGSHVACGLKIEEGSMGI